MIFGKDENIKQLIEEVVKWKGIENEPWRKVVISTMLYRLQSVSKNQSEEAQNILSACLVSLGLSGLGADLPFSEASTPAEEDVDR